MRLAVRWDGGMVRSGVGVVRDARVSKPSFTSPTPQARRRAARARLEAAAAPREAPSEAVPHPFPSRARVMLRFALFFAHARR